MLKRTKLEDEYFRFFREEAQSRRKRAWEQDEQAQADAVERRLLRAEIATHHGPIYCPACGNALSAQALEAGGPGCPACAGRSLRSDSSVHETGLQGIRRKLLGFFLL